MQTIHALPSLDALMPVLVSATNTGLTAELPLTKPTTDTVDTLWHLYRAAWRGCDIDLHDLLRRSLLLLELHKTDAALQMLVGSVQRDLAQW